MEKKVSIIILTFENFNGLEKALKSVYKQNYKNLELIISDDGSKNYNNEFFKNLIKRMEKIRKINVKLIHHKVNKGTVQNFNEAIKNASGEYICGLAQDDEYYDENTIKKIVDNFGNALILTTVREVSEKNKENLEERPNIEERKRFLKKNKYIDLLVNGNFISGSCTFYRKEVFRKYGKFDEEYRLLEDYSYYLKLFKNNEVIKFSPIKTIKYNYGGISTTNTINLNLEKDYIKLYSKEQKNVKGYIKRVLDYKILKIKIKIGERKRISELMYLDILIIKIILKVLRINLFDKFLI